MWRVPPQDTPNTKCGQEKTVRSKSNPRPQSLLTSLRRDRLPSKSKDREPTLTSLCCCPKDNTAHALRQSTEQIQLGRRNTMLARWACWHKGALGANSKISNGPGVGSPCEDSSEEVFSFGLLCLVESSKSSWRSLDCEYFQARYSTGIGGHYVCCDGLVL